MNIKQLFDYLEEAFKGEGKNKQRDILGQLQIAINDSVVVNEGQALIIKMAIERLANVKGYRLIDELNCLLALATYVNSCH